MTEKLKLTPEDEARFWNRVESSPDSHGACQNWLGPFTPSGSPQMRIGRRMHRATRISYMLSKGEIPEGLHIWHACDNPKCVAPEHLFLSISVDNVNLRAPSSFIEPGSCSGWRAK